MSQNPFEALSAPTGEERGGAAAEKAFRSEKPQRVKRFYRSASVSADEVGDFVVLLDSRPLRTPGKAIVRLPTESLAALVAAEWEAQAVEVDPATMPLTRLVNAAIDGVEGNVAPVRDEMIRYAGSDLLCYRADEPEGLVAMQMAAWDPILAWAETALGARFVLAAGVMPVEQSADAIAAVDRALPPAPALLVAALQSLTTLTGSVLVTLALHHGRIGFDEAWNAAHIDEDWNIRLWGADREAAERRRFREAEARAAAAVVTSLREDAQGSGKTRAAGE